MFRTLGCLALAMTSTAVALHWLDPSTAVHAESLSAEDVHALTRSLVIQAVEIQQDQWREVEVVAGPAEPVGGTSLAAQAEPGGIHFYVNVAGRPMRARGWSRQTPPYDSPHTVRIRVDRVAESTPFPSRAQWFTIQSLIGALDSALSRNGTMRIRVQGDSADSGTRVLSLTELRSLSF